MEHIDTALQEAGQYVTRILANTLNYVIHPLQTQHPDWLFAVEKLLFIAVIMHLIYSSRNLDTASAILITLIFLILLVIVDSILLLQYGFWFKLALPAGLLLLGQLVLIMISVTRSINQSIKPDIDNSENQYTLGLAFLQQGHLDWAFEKLKLCPTDTKLQTALFKLGIAYEHKGMLQKAISVYRYMTNYGIYHPNLKDRLDNLQSSHQTLPERLTDQQSSLQQPDRPLPGLLSRIDHYQLEEELGKGAMGKVYRGYDLNSYRQVAIKTLQLADEFDAAELENVKQRFFREAETAGQLHHPNIVSIYDAGETNGLAWIAMELLTGHDLMRYTMPDRLLPPVMVMGIVYKAAKALNYAHANNVIHRDIKPANIMFDPDRKLIRITDFGIARIIDVNRTRTGIVLGTPSYMSPEQLAGSKIDGRSDLFALGVMLFHLLTGELPFKGESLAMLMYLIANEPHRDLRKVRPDVAQSYPDLAAIIDKALEKDAEDRFQSGNEMASALKRCAKK